MTALSGAHQKAIALMAEAAPEAVLRQLATVLRGASDPKAEAIRGMVLTEMADRETCALVFGPLTPMFRPRADGVRAHTFPREARRNLWTLLKSRQPRLVAQAAAMVSGEARMDPRILDQLCVSAAHVMRESPAAVCSMLTQEQAQTMAESFDLAPLIRGALPGLKAWSGRADPQAEAGLRLLARDCARVAEDGAVRLMEILFANLSEAALVLRVASRASGAGGEERLLAESELSDFGERLFEALEADARAVETFDPAREEVGAARALGERLTRAAAMIEQMGLSLDLPPDGVWGARFHALKLRISQSLVERLQRCEGAIEKALPMRRERLGGAMTRLTPRLDAPAVGPVVDQARATMALLGSVRDAAPILGCGGPRTQICEILVRRLDHYGDETLEALNAGEACDEAEVAKLAALCADFLAEADADAMSKALRRRLAAAGGASAPTCAA